VDLINDWLILLKSNAGNIATGLVGLVTTVLGYKVMFGKNNIDLAKVKVDYKNADLADSKLALDRANAIDQRMDRLVAHLERQLENQANIAKAEREAARLEREEMKKVMTSQTREIRSLRDHIDALAQTIINLGGIVPKYLSPSDNDSSKD
jgi:hypothetical protein